MTQFLRAEGPISRSYWKLAALAASCEEWYFRICGRADPTAGMERIYWPTARDTARNDEGDEVDLPTDARPRLIIDDSPVFDLSADGNDTVLFRGALMLSIEIPVFERYEFWPQRFWPDGFWPADWWPAHEIDERDRKTAFTNAVGRLLMEMWQKRGTTPGPNDPVDPDNTSHLWIVQIEQVESPGLCNPAEWGGNYFAGAVYRVHWQGVM